MGKPFWLDAVKLDDGTFYYNPTTPSLDEVSSDNFIDNTNVNQEVGSCITATGKTGAEGKFTKEVADCDSLASASLVICRMASSRQEESVAADNSDYFTGLDDESPFIDPTQFSGQLEQELLGGEGQGSSTSDLRDEWSGLPKMPSCLDHDLTLGNIPFRFTPFLRVTCLKFR